MTYSKLALKALFTLPAIASLSAAAQDSNKPFRDAMDRVTKKRAINPVLPGDKEYTCVQIRAELARLDRQLAAPWWRSS